MAARCVCVLLISAVVIIVTGTLASWITRFQHSEIRMKSSIKSFTISSDAAQKEMTTLASASGVSNTPTAQIITNILGTTSVNVMSGSSVVSRASSVASAEPLQQTTAETAAVSAAGETIVPSQTIEKVKIHTLPGTKKAEIQETAEATATACTQIQESADVETSTNTAQKTPESERMSESVIIQTQKSETERSVTAKQELGTTIIPLTTATANIRSATPIPEPVTVKTTHFITSIPETSKITPENIATTKTRPDITFRTEAVVTETKADVNEGKSAPTTTIIKRPTTAETGPSEASEKTTVRPQKSQAMKTSNGPTINEATGINLITMIQIATGKQAETVGKQTGRDTAIISNVLTTIKSIVNDLSTISQERQTAKVIEKLTTRSHKSDSPCTGNCQTKSTAKKPRGQDEKTLSQKTFYSAVTLGSILVVCGVLALIVFIKDCIGPE